MMRNIGTICILVVVIIVVCITSHVYHKLQQTTEHLLIPSFSKLSPIPANICPPEGASFDQKKFYANEKCFAHETVDCKDVLKHLKIPVNVSGLSESEASAALDVLANNTYVNISDSDNTLYSTNQCIIPQEDRNKLGLDSCRIGDVQFIPVNTKDDQVGWTYDEGCIITEDQLRNNLGDVLKYINKKFKENKETIQSNIGQSIQQNKDNTSALWVQFNSNNNDTASNKRSAQDARAAAQSARTRTSSLAVTETSLANSANTTNSSAGTQEGRFGQMRKDCGMHWVWTSCSASCGGGIQHLKYTPNPNDPAQNGGSCQREQVYGPYSCNTHSCIRYLSSPYHFGGGWWVRVDGWWGDATINFRDRWGNIHYHWNLRASHGVVVQNTLNGGGWGGEERVSFGQARMNPGGYTLFIFPHKDRFQWYSNDWQWGYWYWGRLRDREISYMEWGGSIRLSFA